MKNKIKFNLTKLVIITVILVYTILCVYLNLS